MERHPEARRSLERPVISIGNLTVGGTGKTPVVAHVARWLVDRGERPAILSRGYKRRVRRDGVTVVSDGERVLCDPDEAGDEPLMLARRVAGAAVCVADDRVLAGALAERALGCTVHVLDDGFQHLRLNRDLDVLVTGPGETSEGRVLPMGRLREPIDAAARAHLLIVVGADRQAAAAEAWALGIGESAGAARVLGEPYIARPAFTSRDAARAAAEGGAPLNGGEAALGERVRPDARPIVAVAGIARPERFFDALDEAGWTVGEALPFPDHHAYRPSDIARIAAAARACHARLVMTTEKDAVRFEACGGMAFDLAAAPLELVFDPWETVAGAIEAALDRARGALASGRRA